jgi:hypothetical protein
VRCWKWHVLSLCGTSAKGRTLRGADAKCEVVIQRPDRRLGAILHADFLQDRLASRACAALWNFAADGVAIALNAPD